MFISLFNTLRATGIPCTLRELLDLIAAVEKNLGFADMEKFYFLSRAILVKDEKHYDKFDRAFDIYFKGIESLDDILEMLIPEEWLKAEFEKHLTEEELKKIDSLGGLEKLLEEFKKRMEEQEERHEGGSKYIGTGGTSPFGNSGENPEGIRVGGEGGKGKAVKVWESRDFKNLENVFELLLEHEIGVTESINNLVDICLQEKDYTTHNFVQWYVSEQLEEEALARTILDKLRLIGGDKGGMYMFDRAEGANMVLMEIAG